MRGACNACKTILIRPFFIEVFPGWHTWSLRLLNRDLRPIGDTKLACREFVVVQKTRPLHSLGINVPFTVQFDLDLRGHQLDRRKRLSFTRENDDFRLLSARFDYGSRNGSVENLCCVFCKIFRVYIMGCLWVGEFWM